MIKENKVIYNKSTGKVHCENCKKLLAILHNPEMSLHLSIVCPCQTFCEIRVEKVKAEEGFAALDVDGSIICRNCGKTLFDIEKSNIVNFAFRVKCDCGAVLEKAEEYRKPERRLGDFAEILKEE